MCITEGTPDETGVWGWCTSQTSQSPHPLFPLRWQRERTDVRGFLSQSHSHFLLSGREIHVRCGENVWTSTDGAVWLLTVWATLVHCYPKIWCIPEFPKCVILMPTRVAHITDCVLIFTEKFHVSWKHKTTKNPSFIWSSELSKTCRKSMSAWTF